MTSVVTDSRRSYQAFKNSMHQSAGGVNQRSNIRVISSNDHDIASTVRNQGATRRPPSSRSPRVRSRRRFAVGVLIAFTIAALMLPATSAFGGKTLVSSERQDAALESSELVVVVEPGDTLWSIAKKLEPNKDPRKVVDDLSRARGTSQVIAGEKITWTK